MVAGVVAMADMGMVVVGAAIQGGDITLDGADTVTGVAMAGEALTGVAVGAGPTTAMESAGVGATLGLPLAMGLGIPGTAMG